MGYKDFYLFLYLKTIITRPSHSKHFQIYIEKDAAKNKGQEGEIKFYFSSWGKKNWEHEKK